MAQFFPGYSTCPLCGRVLLASDDVVLFSAFLPADHVWGHISDATLHQSCFKEWDQAEPFAALYGQFKSIWASIPRTLPRAEQEAWLDGQLAEFSRLTQHPPDEAGVKSAKEPDA